MTVLLPSFFRKIDIRIHHCYHFTGDSSP